MVRKSILPADWEVPEALRKRLGEEAGRQRVMEEQGHLLLILHRAPRPEERLRHGRFFWRSPEGGWQASELGEGFDALNRHLDEYYKLLEQLEKAENSARDSADYFRVLEALAPAHRAARNMHQVLQEARQRRKDDERLIVLRDRSYAIERMAELLYGATKNGLEYAMARRAEQQAAHSERMAILSHRLNLLVAFFFPVATLSSIFGMELRNNLEQHLSPPLPFFIVLAVGLGCGALLTLLVTRRLKSKAKSPAK